MVRRILLVMDRSRVSKRTDQFSPSLVSTVRQVVAVCSVVSNVGLSMSLSFVTIQVSSGVGRLVLFQDGARRKNVARNYRLYLRVFVLRTSDVMIEVESFVFVTRYHDSLFELGTRLSAGHDRHRETVVLHASTRRPITTTRTLRVNVLVVVEYSAFLLYVLHLEDPRILAVQGRGYESNLSVFLAALSRRTHDLNVYLYHARRHVSNVRLTSVFRAVGPLVRFLLPSVPKVVVHTVSRLSCKEGRSVPLVRRRLRRRTVLHVLVRCRLRINDRQGRAVRLFHFVSRSRRTYLFAYSYQEGVCVGRGERRAVGNYVVAGTGHDQ